MVLPSSTFWELSLYLTSFEMILLPWGRETEIFQGLVLHEDSGGIKVYWPRVPLSPSFSLFSVSLGCFVVIVVFHYFFLSFDGGSEGRVSDEEARRFT